jgi:hypothetical protein
MKAIQKSGSIAGAGQSRPQLDISRLQALLVVAEVSISMIAAENVARAARSDYEDEIRKYERLHGRLGCGINPSKPEHGAAIKYTAEAYERYCLARRQIYNAKRRLLTAVRRAQRGAA